MDSTTRYLVLFQTLESCRQIPLHGLKAVSIQIAKFAAEIQLCTQGVEWNSTILCCHHLRKAGHQDFSVSVFKMRNMMFDRGDIAVNGISSACDAWRSTVR